MSEQQIVELASKSERYYIALLGCAVGARNGLKNEEDARVALEFILKEVTDALEEANTNGEALHGNSYR